MASSQSGSVEITVVPIAEGNPYADSLAGKPLPEKIELFYFYEQSCEICDELDAFYEILSDKLPHEVRDRYPHRIYTINVFSTDGRKTYEELTDAMGLDRMLLQVPLLVAGGRIFQGKSAISENIHEAFLTAGEDLFVNRRFYNPALKKTGPGLFEDYSRKAGHVTLVYFYRTVCPYCEQVRPFINSLPETVKVGEQQLPLDIIRINTRSGNNSERVMAFFETYQVPDADRKVPIVFLADTYLSGVESITGELSAKLSAPPVSNKLAELIR